jgi:spermidine/putrescine transport system ATP-binding protein
VTAIVELHGLTKRFGTFTALDGISLDVATGEFLTVLGASGSGKTTTLRLIAGFDLATDGRILIEGVDVVALPPFKRPVNTVFQQYALFPHMSVRDNVAYGLRMQRVPGREIGPRVTEALDMVQLGPFANRAPRQLSGGQQQRVALARAIVNRPKVLLLDEPLGALDLKLRRAMQLELKQLQTQLGITFIYVTHDQEEALTMSDRVALMRQGRIEQLGPPRELYDRPRSRYVADFVGETNLLPVTVTDRDPAIVTVTGAAGPMPVHVATVGPDVPRTGAQVWLSVRPESLTISRAADGPPAATARPGDGRGNQLPATVRDIVYAGSVVKVHAVLADGVTLVALRAPADPPVATGDAVHVTWAADRGVLVAD